MITLFTIPRAFTGGDKVRQENTLGSWTRLDPRPEIILFCDDPGVAEAAERFGCIHVPDIKCNENSIPFIGEAFRLASQIASNSILCYANADIIFIQDFIVAVKVVARKFDEPFLIIGQRRNISLPGPLESPSPLEFTEGWQQRLRAQARQHGTLHSSSAIDYFVYSRGAIVNLPAFLVGSPKWDNWTVRDAENRGCQVVNATQAITCIHQWHQHVWPARGAHYNHRAWRKAGGGVGHTYSGTWVLGAGAKLRGKPPKKAWVASSIKTWTIPEVTTGPEPKRRFKSKPRPQPRSWPQRTKPPRPTHAAPKDKLDLPINLNVSAWELVGSAKRLRQQARLRTPKKKKHSHSALPERKRILAERAKLQQAQDTIQAARIEARDARLLNRKKKRP